MLFKQNSPMYAVEVDRKEGENIMYVNYLGAPFSPSLAENAEVMSRTIDELTRNPNVSRIVFVQQRNYHYPFEQVKMLAEIAQLHNHLIKQDKVLSPERLSLFGDVQKFHSQVSYLMSLMRSDPVACYIEIRNLINKIYDIMKSGQYTDLNSKGYVRFLDKVREMLEGTLLIKKVQEVIETYYAGDRTIYDSIFRPDVMPNFTFTRLVAQLPENARLIDQYEVEHEGERIQVTILKKEMDSKHFYHIMPPEYTLNEEHQVLLNLGKNVLIEHQPKAEEFTDPDRTRSIFFNVAQDLIRELAESKKYIMSYREISNLARILVRQTIGSGLIEVLLMDRKLQDIFLNSPISQNPIFVRHEEYGECVTNIIPSYEDADSWASKLRLQSGRPLDEANPILDTDLVFGGVRARVSAIQKPLSPQGLAYAIRRHRDAPWTLPLFIKNKMINSFAAGLLSFLIDGSRTLLIAGTRSSGKTSFLGSTLLEIMPKIRTIVIEDTLELPVDALRNVGYNIQRMKVRSALLESSTEIDASEGIRASLRLGDSALIVGEIRSNEAKALYEAMRVGALANVVAGTIHGASPYGVFDRLVNDLGVPVTSFKATDLVLVTNPIKTPDGMHSMKRVVQLAEVRKHWTKDPLEEKGFVDLLRYNVEKDELEPTEELMNGESEILKDIASNVKGWAGNWEAIYDNILLRGKVKQEIVNVSDKMKKPELMEAKFVTLANDAFHKISDEVTKETGLPKSDIVFSEWQSWLAKESKKFSQ